MADLISLKFAGKNIKFKKSQTKVAFKASKSRGRMMEAALMSLERRVPVEREGRLGGFEIVDIQAPAAEVATESARMGRMTSIRAQVPVYHTSEDEIPFIPEGTIHLSFKKDTINENIENLFRRNDFALISVTDDGFYTVGVPEIGADALEIAANLQKELIVSTAEPDLVTPMEFLSFLPDDELLSKQWHLENKGEYEGHSAGYVQGADSRVVAAWKRLGNLGDPNAMIAIIDDGVDLTHPDFLDKAVQPWDFIRGSDNVQPQADPFNQAEGDWHGTACAGVAVGVHGGGKIVGAAPNAKMIPIRVGSELSPLEVEKWFDYVTNHGAWVVSCSWGSKAKVYPLPERIRQAISRCAKEGRNGKGCVIVFAAGNSGLDINDEPNSHNGFATHPDVLAVAASTSLDRRANYSNLGKEIAVCAPSSGRGGWRITTTDVTGTYVDTGGVERHSGYNSGAYTFSFTGTSSACPLVAGVCSLVLSANPSLTAQEVRNIIRKTARKIGSDSEYKNGHSVKYGFGCINAESAVVVALEAKNREVR